jgi:nucleotide-binding universal stress UspA family protein
MMPEELMMLAGCPVLLLPHGHAGGEIGRNILVAWKQTREAVRVVRGARGFFEMAERVTVLTVEPDSDDADSLAEVAGYFKRYDVTAETEMREEGDGVGETILARANELGSDLIVMGAYGHSRLREIVLGGVTRHMVRESKIPLLMTH